MFNCCDSVGNCQYGHNGANQRQRNQSRIRRCVDGAFEIAEDALRRPTIADADDSALGEIEDLTVTDDGGAHLVVQLEHSRTWSIEAVDHDDEARVNLRLFCGREERSDVLDGLVRVDLEETRRRRRGLSARIALDVIRRGALDEIEGGARGRPVRHESTKV